MMKVGHWLMLRHRHCSPRFELKACLLGIMWWEDLLWIKTGLNEAFVIDAETKEKLIAEDPKSAELIKPFLAGRDIKRYQPPRATNTCFMYHGISPCRITQV